MLENYGAATKIIPIVGHPIVQAKSPKGLTAGFEARGENVAVVPFDVGPAMIAPFLAALDHAANLQGILATVPHKFATFQHAKTASGRARFFGSANVLRRAEDGGWYADMLDGLGFIEAVRIAGGQIDGRRALLVGGGGAGSAIARELLAAGAASLAVHDVDVTRRDLLLLKLNQDFPGRAAIGSDDPTGFDIIANATPLGMRAGDPPPVLLDKLQPHMVVGDVVTGEDMAPLMRAARELGCVTSTGVDMFNASIDLMLDFFTDRAP